MSTSTLAITDRQRAFVIDMLHVAFPDQDADDMFAVAADRGAFANAAATRASIDALIVRRDEARKAARAAAPAAARPVVAEGCYALPIDGVEGGWSFYRVKAGRVPGRMFVNRFRSDALDRLSWAQQAAIMADIAVDVDAAGQAFARESECCRRCGRRLTDKPTAARNGGYGPECVTMI